MVADGRSGARLEGAPGRVVVVVELGCGPVRIGVVAEREDGARNPGNERGRRPILRPGGAGDVTRAHEHGVGSGGRHGDGDRLAVGDGAIRDAHVEDVASDLTGDRRPGEGAAARDRSARRHRARGAVGEREGERVTRVGIGRGRGEGELRADLGALVAHRVQGGRTVAWGDRRQRGDLGGRERRVEQEGVVHCPLQRGRPVRLRTDAESQVIGR